MFFPSDRTFARGEANENRYHLRSGSNGHWLGSTPAHAQVIGSYDNFDCFNDTGQTAEGFEIGVEEAGRQSGADRMDSGPATAPGVAGEKAEIEDEVIPCR